MRLNCTHRAKVLGTAARLMFTDNMLKELVGSGSIIKVGATKPEGSGVENEDRPRTVGMKAAVVNGVR